MPLLAETCFPDPLFPIQDTLCCSSSHGCCVCFNHLLVPLLDDGIAQWESGSAEKAHPRIQEGFQWRGSLQSWQALHRKVPINPAGNVSTYLDTNWEWALFFTPFYYVSWDTNITQGKGNSWVLQSSLRSDSSPWYCLLEAPCGKDGCWEVVEIQENFSLCQLQQPAATGLGSQAACVLWGVDGNSLLGLEGFVQGILQLPLWWFSGVLWGLQGFNSSPCWGPSSAARSRRLA